MIEFSDEYSCRNSPHHSYICGIRGEVCLSVNGGARSTAAVTQLYHRWEEYKQVIAYITEQGYWDLQFSMFQALLLRPLSQACVHAYRSSIKQVCRCTHVLCSASVALQDCVDRVTSLDGNVLPIWHIHITHTYGLLLSLLHAHVHTHSHTFQISVLTQKWTAYLKLK